MVKGGGSLGSQSDIGNTSPLPLSDSQMAVPVITCLEVRRLLLLLLSVASSSRDPSSTNHDVSCRITLRPQPSWVFIAAEIFCSRDLTSSSTMSSLDVVCSSATTEATMVVVVVDATQVVVAAVVEVVIIVVFLFATASAHELGPPGVLFWEDDLEEMEVLVMGLPRLHTPAAVEAHAPCCCCCMLLPLLLPPLVKLLELLLLLEVLTKVLPGLLLKFLLELLLLLLLKLLLLVLTLELLLLLLLKLLLKLLLLLKVLTYPELGLEFKSAGLLEMSLLLVCLLDTSCCLLLQLSVPALGTGLLLTEPQPEVELL